MAGTIGRQNHDVEEAPENLPPAKADANQLEVALLNLLVDARDAMPDRGTLRILATAETVERRGGRVGLMLGSYT